MSVDENPTVVVKRNINSNSENDNVSTPIEGPLNIQPFFKRYLRIKNQLAREFVAEVLGTFILCVFGLGAVAQFKFFSRDGNVNFLAVNVGFGFGATLAVLIIGKISGAHLNPAVSLAMLITGKMTYVRFFVYSLGQLIGAFLGALIVFLVYLDVLKSYGNNMYDIDLAGIFATYPNKYLTPFGGFFDQLVATALLVITVLSLTDKRNAEIPHATASILVGITILIIGTSFSYNCGYAINPARDFGPRLLTWIVGFGTQTFTSNSYFFWVPIIGPLSGSIVGSLIYITMVSSHWTD